jgi:hypothetical protein
MSNPRSNLRNSIFSGVVPVMEKSHPDSQQPATQQSVASRSTGSALLDAFITDAEQSALIRQAVLTKELTSLSFELKRINNAQAPQPALPLSSATATQETAARQTAAREAVARQTAVKQTVAKQTVARQTAAQDTAKAIEQSAKNRAAHNKALEKAAVRQPASAQLQNRNFASSQPPPQVASQMPPRPQANTQGKVVYGGSHYKALQAKAAAGGLVNLDDTLLFGGTDKTIAKGSSRAQPLQTDADFASYLSHPIEDFTASPIPGGIHFTAHLSETAREGTGSNSGCDRAWHQAVLDIETFKLSDLTLEDAVDLREGQVATSDNSVAVAMETDPAAANPAEFNDLGQQVTYLTQRIDYLSQKLAELTTAELPNHHQPSAITPVDQNRSPSVRNPVVQSTVLLGIEALQLSETAQRAEKRVATLDSLFHMPRLT